MHFHQAVELKCNLVVVVDGSCIVWNAIEDIGCTVNQLCTLGTRMILKMELMCAWMVLQKSTLRNATRDQHGQADQMQPA